MNGLPWILTLVKGDKCSVQCVNIYKSEWLNAPINKFKAGYNRYMQLYYLLLMSKAFKNLCNSVLNWTVCKNQLHTVMF